MCCDLPLDFRQLLGVRWITGGALRAISARAAERVTPAAKILHQLAAITPTSTSSRSLRLTRGGYTVGCVGMRRPVHEDGAPKTSARAPM